ncbi:hypothetical protein ACIO93_35435 [Streptomyces sp. NPDC087903]|uniref:hypothetical protein n=1 Tax=Streptomyces sp. NPDC087903 TaxID=3365819 RepID=UPI0038186265
MVAGPAHDGALRTSVRKRTVYLLALLGCRAPDRFVVRQREVRGQGGDGVEDTVDGHDGCQARLIGRRAGREKAAEAHAEQHDADRIDARVLGEEVQYRADHVLPVRPEGPPVQVDGRGLPGAVERQDVVAAFLSAEAPRMCSSSAAPSNPLCITTAGFGPLPAVR